MKPFEALLGLDPNAFQRGYTQTRDALKQGRQEKAQDDFTRLVLGGVPMDPATVGPTFAAATGNDPGAALQFRQQWDGQQAAQAQAEQAAAQAMSEDQQDFMFGLAHEMSGLSRPQREALFGHAQAIAQQRGFELGALDPDDLEDATLQRILAVARASGWQAPEVAGGGDPYTLAPGARRFDANNNLIAENPKARDDAMNEYQRESLALRREQFEHEVANPRADAIIDLPGGDGRIVIGGAPGDEQLTGPSEDEDEYIKALARFNTGREQRASMIGWAKEALDGVNKMTAGPGGLLAEVPGSPARDLKNDLMSLKANIGFDRLQRMREESPTGGALGQVSNFELDMLQATLGSLDQLQSPEELRKALRQIVQSLERIDEFKRLEFNLRYQILTEDQVRRILVDYGYSLDDAPVSETLGDDFSVTPSDPLGLR